VTGPAPANFTIRQSAATPADSSGRPSRLAAAPAAVPPLPTPGGNKPVNGFVFAKIQNGFVPPKRNLRLAPGRSRGKPEVRLAKTRFKPPPRIGAAPRERRPTGKYDSSAA
jgi:hypothetical protein